MASCVGSLSKCKVCPKIDIDEFVYEKLQQLLPEDFCYVICEYAESESELGAFDCTLRARVFTAEDCERWFRDFQLRTKMTFRIERGGKVAAKRVLYKGDFRCQHRTYSRTTTADRRKTSKNTCCPASLKMRLQKSKFLRATEDKTIDTMVICKRKSQSRDKHIPNFPLHIVLKMHHNHPLYVLHHRDVGPEAEERIRALLLDNYSPTAALRQLKRELESRYGDEHKSYAVDRYHCPDLGWCFRFYYRLFKTRVRKRKCEILSTEATREDEERQTPAAEQEHREEQQTYEIREDRLSENEVSLSSESEVRLMFEDRELRLSETDVRLILEGEERRLSDNGGGMEQIYEDERRLLEMFADDEEQRMFGAVEQHLQQPILPSLCDDELAFEAELHRQMSLVSQPPMPDDASPEMTTTTQPPPDPLLLQRFRAACETIEHLYFLDRSFEPAISAFCSQVEQTTTTDEIKSALRSFDDDVASADADRVRTWLFEDDAECGAEDGMLEPSPPPSYVEALACSAFKN